jgi:hypothetical protein
MLQHSSPSELRIKMTVTIADEMNVRDRIKDLRRVPARDLVPNLCGASTRAMAPCPRDAYQPSRRRVSRSPRHRAPDKLLRRVRPRSSGIFRVRSWHQRGTDGKNSRHPGAFSARC